MNTDTNTRAKSWRERIIFLKVECQLTNVEGKMELEICHSATITVVTHPSKNHQWVLKVVGKI